MIELLTSSAQRFGQITDLSLSMYAYVWALLPSSFYFYFLGLIFEFRGRKQEMASVFLLIGWTVYAKLQHHYIKK